jgi:hypothetical protein
MKIFGVVFMLGLLVALALKLAGKDKRSRESARGWRVRCVVAGRWAYEELHGDVWSGVAFDELGDYRESPHIIDVRSLDRWEAYPDWARERRATIIDRIKAELPRSHYCFREATPSELAMPSIPITLTRLSEIEKRPII